MKSLKPRNILVMIHWSWFRHRGGAEMMMRSMLLPLAERGHSIDVLEGWQPLNDSYRHEGFEDNGIRIHPFRNREDPFAYLDRTDLIITHLQQTERAISICPWVHKPAIVLCHNDYVSTAHSLDPRYAGFVYPVYNSQWMKTSLERRFTGPHPHGLIVRPPVYADDYRTTPGDHVTLINLSADKGAALFYELARRMPNTKFLGVVGAHGDQIIREDLPNVEIVPHSANMRDDVYRRTRILLIPSAYESWGRVGTEAVASGIPVIAQPTDGLRENLGDAAVFVDRDNIGSWVAHLRRLAGARAWHHASQRAVARSAELESLRESDLSEWVRYAEAARWLGR